MPWSEIKTQPTSTTRSSAGPGGVSTFAKRDGSAACAIRRSSLAARPALGYMILQPPDRGQRYRLLLLFGAALPRLLSRTGNLTLAGRPAGPLRLYPAFKHRLLNIAALILVERGIQSADAARLGGAAPDLGYGASLASSDRWTAFRRPAGAGGATRRMLGTVPRVPGPEKGFGGHGAPSPAQGRGLATAGIDRPSGGWLLPILRTLRLGQRSLPGLYADVAANGDRPLRLPQHRACRRSNARGNRQRDQGMIIALGAISVALLGGKPIALLPDDGGRRLGDPPHSLPARQPPLRPFSSA